MSKEQFANLAFEDRKEMTKLIPKVLFLSLLLLLSHVLEIQPSELDAGGMKLAIKDLVIIRGVIALLFLYYFWYLTAQMITLDIYDPINIKRPMMVNLLVSAKKPYKPSGKKRREQRTPKQAKRRVRWQIFAYNAWMFPLVLVAAALIVGAVIFAFYDTFQFFEYLKVKIIEMY